VSTTILLNSGVYRLFGTPFGIKITPPVKHYIILSNKWGAVHVHAGFHWETLTKKIPVKKDRLLGSEEICIHSCNVIL
ncbi:MAG: hypothetical protein ACLR58_03415, partial [Eubacteriales bacterium]